MEHHFSENDNSAHQIFYQRTIKRIHSALKVDDDVCFIYVQHAFTPSIDFFDSVKDKTAGIILKRSSAKANPAVAAKLKSLFPDHILDGVDRQMISDSTTAIDLLKNITQGRRFAILEYGGYFAPVAKAISLNQDLSDQFVGIVEGTENGLTGSGDGQTLGYNSVAREVHCPIISKSRSNIKQLMDLEIGPAIVECSEQILRQKFGVRLKYWRGQVGVIGLGPVGSGLLEQLNKENIQPLVHDTDLFVAVELAFKQHQLVTLEAILSKCDILYLSTGNCFLAQRPELLGHLKNNTLLILCTSGDVEAGIPQLIAGKHLFKIPSLSDNNIAAYSTKYGTTVKVMLGNDGVGQAPNLTAEDGSSSPANMMSDMEFYALGCYLGSAMNKLPHGRVSDSPGFLQRLIMEEWLDVFHPNTSEKSAAPHTIYRPAPATTNKDNDRKHIIAANLPA